MRLLLAFTAGCLAVMPAAWQARRAEPSGVVARRLDPPAERTAGGLRWLGGWVLSARDRRFGGFSAIAVVDGRPVLLSDAGWLLRLGPDIAWRDVAAAGDKAGRDTESLARDARSGRWWIGLEGRNAVARLDAAGGAVRLVRPAAMRRWPANGGAESLARLTDDRFVLIAESASRSDGARQALLFPGDPLGGRAPIPFGYRPPAGMDASDAAALPDGRLLVLDRRLGPTGFTAALTLVDPAGIRRGQVLEGRPVARLGRPWPIDNLEGVAVSREGGRTVVWLVSDDNFLPFQRTLLLKLALLPPGT